MTTIAVDFVYWRLAVALVVFAAGMGLAGTPGTTAITGSLPPEKQGVGSAVNDTSRELGSALGIAILGTVLNSVYRSSIADSAAGLPAALATRAQASIAFVRQGADQLAALGPAGNRLVVAARSGFVDAARTSFAVAGVTLLVVAVVVIWRAPGRGTPAASADPAADGSTAATAAPAPR